MLVERVASREVIRPAGRFTLHAYVDRVANETHLAMVYGDPASASESLVRVHEPLGVLDFLDPKSTRHSVSIALAEKAIAQAGAGVIVMMHRPQTGSELLAAFRRDDAEAATPRKWDSRLHGIGAQILRDLGVRRMRLLGRARRIPSMVGFDLEVTGFLSPAE
jgi:3,4-dihydroxy 2-butanone 4-phosphate synthase/GTP cyclohydrolase II